MCEKKSMLSSFYNLELKPTSINRNSSNIYDRKIQKPSQTYFEETISDKILNSVVENISGSVPRKKKRSVSRSKPKMLTQYVDKDIVTFERLQRLIIVNKEVIKLMTSRLATYSDLYLKYFQSQMSTSAPRKTVSHNLYEDAKKFCRDFNIVPKLISIKT